MYAKMYEKLVVCGLGFTEYAKAKSKLRRFRWCYEDEGVEV